MFDLLQLPTCSNPNSIIEENTADLNKRGTQSASKPSQWKFSHSNSLFKYIIFFIVFRHFIVNSLAESSGKCYTFGPGLTIPGADFRRDIGISLNQCAVACKTDACCLAFEWLETVKGIGMCTLKSRSLNGTVTTVPKSKAGNDIYFGLCLDYDDSERDRFWDHEITGPVVTSHDKVDREKCAALCKSPTDADEEGDGQKESTLTAEKHNNGLFNSRMTRSTAAKHQKRAKPVIYNWRSDDPMDVDAKTGKCECISLLHSIRLSFGSFAGFLI